MRLRSKLPMAMLVVLFSIIFQMLAEDANAIPIFARKYNRPCYACHTAPPMLNEFGQRFRNNGYQLPGTHETKPFWDSGQMPLSILTSVGYEYEKADGEDAVRTFGVSSADLLFGGNVAENVSLFGAMVVDGGPNDNGDTEFEALVENVTLVFNNLLGSNVGNLNLKIGVMNPSLPFYPPLELSGVEPHIFEYDPWDGVNSGNPPILRERQYGAAVFGFLPEVVDGLYYEAGLFQGTNGNIDNNTSMDILVRLQQTVYVNNAPFRVGVFHYSGEGVFNAGAGDEFKDAYARTAFDVEAYDPWTKKLNVGFTYMMMTDDDVSSAADKQKMDANGMVVHANYFLVPEKWIAFAKYSTMTVEPDGGESEDVATTGFGLRYNIAANLWLTGEYFMNEEGDAKSSAAGLGAAFAW
jgi:hypothetical protein